LALGLLVLPWLLACWAVRKGALGASIVCSEALMLLPTKQPHQALHPTLGYLRLHNINLRDRVLPLAERGTAYVVVFQQR
jgi:hypothetical protein